MPREHGFPAARERGLIVPAASPLIIEAARQGGRYAAGIRQTTLAAEVANIQLFNPGDREREVIVEEILVASDVASLVFVRVENTRLTTFEYPWVSLGEDQHDGLAQVRTQLNFGAGGRILARMHTRATGIEQPIRLGLILRPGRGVLVDGGTTGTDIAVTFIGRERPI